MPTQLDGDLWSDGNAIHCPYCEAAAMDAADASTRDDVFQCECDGCGQLFLVERIVSVEFVSRRLPEPMEQLALPFERGGA